MDIEIFELERTQSLWENTVEYNLTETGIHPFTLKELLQPDELEKMLSIRMGYGQTNGSTELRDVISAMYSGSHRDNILVTGGSIEANFIAVWTMLKPGDELILMLPNYMQIWGIARAFGIEVKPFFLKEDLNWQPDLDELRKLVTPRTKMIAVCNPNNPTGAILNKEAMDEIIESATGVDAWIYSDEVYRGAELSGDETESFYGRYDRVIVAGGLSKTYSLPGMRIGWLVGPEKEIANCWSRRDYTSISTNIISNYVAALVLQPERRKQILTRNRGILNMNLATLTGWVEKHKNLLNFIPPRAGGMAFLRYNMDINSTKLATRIRTEKSTFIVAGDCFGMDGRIRIGIGSEPEYMQSGLNRVSEILSEYS